MALTILVLHGPNLHWLGEEDIDTRLESRADELGIDLVLAQSNGEGSLIDELHEEEDELDGVIVNPGVLAPNAWALAEALQLVGVPAVEVLLKDIPKERGLSALTGVVRQQIHGKGHDGYLHALDALAGIIGAKPDATPSVEEQEEAAAEEEEEDEAGPVRHVTKAGKSIGKKRAPAPEPAIETRGGKTIGRRAKNGEPAAAAPAAKSIGRKAEAPESKSVGRAPASSSKSVGLTRALVREKVADRLAKRLAPEALAAWARAEWSALQQGGPCEAGFRETLDGVLLTLMAGAKASDDVLLGQMAKL